MSRKKRLVTEEGWALHNAVIRPDPLHDALVSPRPVTFVNTCTGAWDVVGEHSPTQYDAYRMRLWQAQNGLGHEIMQGASVVSPVKRSWAEKTTEEILADMHAFAHRVEPQLDKFYLPQYLIDAAIEVGIDLPPNVEAYRTFE